MSCKQKKGEAKMAISEISIDLIVKVIKIVDTREYEVIGNTALGADRIAPIPGSGEIAQCARCGRDHEVHVHVELDNGKVAIIGTGCAKNDSMHIQNNIKRAATVAKRLAKLQAEYNTKKAQLEEYSAIRKNLEETTSYPPVVGPIVVTKKSRTTPYTVYRYSMGGVNIQRLEEIPISEATADLKESWLRSAMYYKGIRCPHIDHDDFRKKIARAKKILANLTA
jgi:hypothetical protein